MEHRLRLAGLIFAVVLISGCATNTAIDISSDQQAPSLSLESSLSGKPGIERTANLSLRVTSSQDAPNTAVSISLPEGIELVSGKLSQTIDLSANRPSFLIAEIRATRPGNFTIEAVATSNGSVNGSHKNESVSAAATEALYLSEEELYAEFADNQRWHYELCFRQGCFIPPKMTKEQINAYVGSFNSTENYTYILVQFSTLPFGTEPNQTHRDILEAKNVTVLRSDSGRNTYAVKAPSRFFANDSFDFIRWIGVKNATDKIRDNVLRDYMERNCTGEIKVDVTFYEPPSLGQLDVVKMISPDIEYRAGYGSAFVTASLDSIQKIIELDFTDYLFVNYPPTKEEDPSINPFNSITCEEVE